MTSPSIHETHNPSRMFCRAHARREDRRTASLRLGNGSSIEPADTDEFACREDAGHIHEPRGMDARSQRKLRGTRLRF